MDKYVWLIPFLPLVGFVINGFGRNTFPKSVIGFIGSFLVFVSFCLSISAFVQVKSTGQFEVNLFDWFSVGTVKVSFAFLIDQLSALMLLIITGVGLGSFLPTLICSSFSCCYWYWGQTTSLCLLAGKAWVFALTC
jgi:NADH-quinone oxidoreductase subunit L